MYYEYTGSKGPCLVHPSSSWHIVGLCSVCGWVSHWDFLCICFGLCFMSFRFRVGLCVFPFLCAKESPCFDWWYPNLQASKARKCRNSVQGRILHWLLFSYLCCEFCWKGGGALFKDLNWVWYRSCRGKLTGGLLICWPWHWPGPFHLETSSYKFTFSLGNSFISWNRKLLDDHRKIHIIEGRGVWEPSLSTSDFMNGERPQEGKGLINTAQGISQWQR